MSLKESFRWLFRLNWRWTKTEDLILGDKVQSTDTQLRDATLGLRDLLSDRG